MQECCLPSMRRRGYSVGPRLAGPPLEQGADCLQGGASWTLLEKGSGDPAKAAAMRSILVPPVICNLDHKHIRGLAPDS
eukprot:6254556-Pyramimonas_sp.AAC.1